MENKDSQRKRRLSLEVLQREREYARAHYAKPEVKQRVKEYHARPDVRQRKREHNLRKRYGISQADFDALWKVQQGQCAACLENVVSTEKICVDHNHNTFVVRGLIHDRCNKVIGLLHEDCNIFRTIASYLENQKSK